MIDFWHSLKRSEIVFEWATRKNLPIEWRVESKLVLLREPRLLYTAPKRQDTIFFMNANETKNERHEMRREEV